MKRTIRTIAVLLCVVMVASSLYGCTINLTVDVQNDAVPAGNNSVVVQPTTPTTTAAPATTAATTAAATDASQPAASDASQPAASDAGEPAAPAPSGELSSSSSKEEIVAEYAKVYNATKATGTFLGKDKMECASVIIDGKENGALKTAAGTFLKSDKTDLQLPPSSESNPSMECLITAADVQEATYTDNGDGTATIKITPIETTNDKQFQGAQGKMFNVMEDVGAALASVPIISWSEGDANSNVTLITKEGYAEVTYDKNTKIMTKADYVLVTYADIVHCNVSLGLINFKDKSANAKFVYTMSFPQS